MAKKLLPYQKIRLEESQAPATRQKLYSRLEAIFEKRVLAYYTSFNQPVMVDDADAGMIESVLQNMALDQGLMLIISSPGGDGLAAERIINICKSYSPSGEFSVLIPDKAKSAATMVCFGASEILMSKTSELGPVDPQLTISENGQLKRFSVCNVIESYRELFEGATKAKGHLEPFLQQLQRYDAREIKEYEDAVALAQDISIRSLAEGMLKGTDRRTIEKKITAFLTPKEKRSHGRPIYHKEAKSCGLNIKLLDVKSDEWKSITELNLRLDNFVSKHAAKCVETSEQSFSAKALNRG